MADALPRFDDLPIPADVTVGAYWAPLMVEIADHIGAHATLRLIARFGGENIRISRAMRRNPFVEVIGEEAATIFCKAFHGEKLDLPVGRSALWHARAAPLLARVRAGDLTIADASRILRVARTRIHALLAQGDAAGAPPRRRRRRGAEPDPRQIDMFASAVTQRTGNAG